MAYAIDIKLPNNRYFTEPCVNCGKYIRYYKDDTDGRSYMSAIMTFINICKS